MEGHTMAKAKFGLRESASETKQIFDVSSDTPIIHNIDIENIVANPNQPRKIFDDASIKELADTIKAKGLLNPCTVRQRGDKYEIVAGERRYRACIIAGFTRIPCFVKILSDSEAFQESLIENLQREDLNPFDEAEGYQRLKEDFGMTHEQIARAVGKTRSSITQTMSVIKLPVRVRENCQRADISKRNLVEIAKASSEDEMLGLVEKLTAGVFKTDQLRKSVGKKSGRKKDKPLTFKAIYKHTESYGAYLMRFSKDGISNLSPDRKKELKEKILANRELEDELLGKL